MIRSTVSRQATASVLLVAAGLAMAAAPAAAQEDTGSITGMVWFDRNSDHTQNAGEPGRANAAVSLFRDGALVDTYRTDGSGAYSITGLAPGAYRLTNASAAGYLSTTARDVDVTVGATAQKVDFGVKGAKLTVHTWYDQNGDGLKQGSDFTTVIGQAMRVQGMEVPIMTRNADSEGKFVFDDLPANPYYDLNAPKQTKSNDILTTRTADSVIDPGNGYSPMFELKAGQERAMGVGYRTQRADIQLVGVLMPGRTPVGKPFTLDATVTNHGPGADAVVVKLTTPAGFRVTGMTGATRSDSAEPNAAVGTTAKVAVGAKVKVVFTVVADRVVTGDMVMWAYPDTFVDPKSDNNELSFQVPVVPATGTSSPAGVPTAENVAHTPAGKKAGRGTHAEVKDLASTGASPVLPLVLASVLLASGGALLFVLRRRATRR